MSELNYIKSWLGIEEGEEIIFTKSAYTVNKDGINYDVIEAELTHRPKHCPPCGVVRENFNITVHDYYKSDIKFPTNPNGNQVRLHLRKPRFKCLECKKSFKMSYSIVKPHHQISNQLELSIFYYVSHVISETNISSFNKVSHFSVNRKIKKTIDEKTKVMCFNEFKSTKDADGAMLFIYKDHDKNVVIDIVEDRRLTNLITYFAVIEVFII